LAVIVLLACGLSTRAADDHVILIPGLLRSPHTMKPMEKALQVAGYKTVILDYPSRTQTIHGLSHDYLAPVILACQKAGAKQIHFVTHSLGGLLVRDYLSRQKLPELGRVVMLAPPNQGSEVVDRIGHWRAFKAVNGPAGGELGTADNSPPKALGPVDFPLGIIAGDRSINWINSCIIPGSDDGKVSVEHTKVKGMTDHIVLHRTHPMIMKRNDSIMLTLRFLRKGRFLDR